MATRAESLERFADELSALRRECGNPSYARLYRSSALLPPATISDVLRGRSVPRIEFVMAFVQACLDHADASDIPVDPVARSRDAWRARWRSMREQIDRAGGDVPGGRARRAREDVPWQLPPTPRWLTGREADLAWLDQEAFAADCQLTVLHGPSGVGKTALAVLWAHHRRDRFPDGQLFIDLRGFGPEPPVPPEDALRYFLTSLGQDVASLTGTREELLGMFRTAVADRRMLIVLDNVRTSEHVRELLAAGENARVLVTSQERLKGLVIREGATNHEVATLSEEDAVALISRHHHELGPDRARRVARACGYLPLALRIVAERLEQDPSSETIDRFLADVEADPGVLVRTDTGDPRSNLDLLFAWALDARSAPERRALLLIADFPGTMITTFEASVIIGVRLKAAQRILSALAGQHLVQPRGPGRQQLHPLLRAWASSVAAAEMPEEERRKARLRLLGYYLWTADAVDRVLLPQRNRPELVSDLPKPITIPPIASRSAAMEWADFHLINLVLSAVGPHAESFAPVLPHVLLSYLNLRKPWGHWLQLTEAGLAALGQGGDDRDRGNLLISHGIALRETGRVDEAVAAFQEAALAYERAGVATGRAMALNNVGAARNGQGRPAEAMPAVTQALKALEGTDDGFRRAIVLHNLAETHLDLGDPAAATPFAAEAVSIAEEIDDHQGAALSLVTLARAHHLMGETDAALAEYAQALKVQEEHGDVFGQVEAHKRLASLMDDLGRSDEAEDHRSRSAALRREFGDTD